MVERRVKIAMGVALAYYVVSLVEVAGKREDWPFSRYPMYSELPGPTATRSLEVGVSDAGEFKLDEEQTAPLQGARLRSINHALERNETKRSAFMRKVAERYEARRRAHGWPVLRALRFYTESWPIQDDLAGIDQPVRRLAASTYFPPKSLLERLKAEARGDAQPEPARSVPAGDVVLDLDASGCESECEAVDDELAAAGRALELEPAGASAASAQLAVELTEGRYTLFVRMQTGVKAGSDRVGVELDGAPVTPGAALGGFRRFLPEEGWVWASNRPGEPPLVLDIAQRGRHVLRFASEVNVRLDEVWLSRSQRELPSDNRVRTP